MRALKSSVYLPLALITLLMFFSTGYKLSIFVMAPIFVWLHFGFALVEKEFPEFTFIGKYLRVWGWGFLYIYKEFINFDKEGRYKILLNEVQIGEITALDLRKINHEVYSSAEAMLDQVRAFLGACIVGVQILIAYTGGLIVWALIISIYVDKTATLNWLEINYRNLNSLKIEALIYSGVIAVFLISLRLSINVYQEKFSQTIRLKLKEPALGRIKIVKIKMK